MFKPSTRCKFTANICWLLDHLLCEMFFLEHVAWRSSNHSNIKIVWPKAWLKSGTFFGTCRKSHILYRINKTNQIATFIGTTPTDFRSEHFESAVPSLWLSHDSCSHPWNVLVWIRNWSSFATKQFSAKHSHKRLGWLHIPCSCCVVCIVLPPIHQPIIAYLNSFSKQQAYSALYHQFRTSYSSCPCRHSTRWLSSTWQGSANSWLLGVIVLWMLYDSSRSLSRAEGRCVDTAPTGSLVQ